MERIVYGEGRKMANLRRSIMELCDATVATKSLDKLMWFVGYKKERYEEVKALWKKWGCPDLTTKAGWSRFMNIYDHYYGLGDYL